MGAIDDQRPLQASPSGITREIPPVLPVIPSTVAVSTGSGESFDIGPSTGNNVAVVEQPQSTAVISKETKLAIRMVVTPVLCAWWTYGLGPRKSSLILITPLSGSHEQIHL